MAKPPRKLSDGLRSVTRAYMESEGLSLRAVARGADVDPGALSRFLAGHCGMLMDALDRLAEFVGARVTAATPKRKRRTR